MLRTVEPGDVLLHKFSPTGFYSSAVKTPFLYDLMHRSERQIPFFKRGEEEGTVQLGEEGKARSFWVTPEDKDKAEMWMRAGHTEPLKTPDGTIIFVTPESRDTIREDQQACMGCLSHCGFSELEGPRRFHHRASGRSAQLLHPEDPAGHRPRR